MFYFCTIIYQKTVINVKFPFLYTGGKSDEQNNTIEESNRNNVEEAVIQSNLVTQSDDVDAQFIFIFS